MTVGAGLLNGEDVFLSNSLLKNSCGSSFRGAKRREISLFLGFCLREIPRFARNDT